MLRVTDASGTLRVVDRPTTVAPLGDGLASLLAVDTFRRTAVLLRVPVVTLDLAGCPALNVHPGSGPGPADVMLHRPEELAIPPYGDPLAVRLAWLCGSAVDDAALELAQWRALVAGWAEQPSKPMCSDVQSGVLGALADDLATTRAVEVLRGSLGLGLPDGCLFETWAWADRLLGLDLARSVGA